MTNPENVVSIHPYFKVKPGNLERAQGLLQEMVKRTRTEPGNLYYDFTLNGDVIFCREAYVGAEGMIRHLENVSGPVGEMLKIADLIRVELHASQENIEKLKGPLAGLNPEWFVFQVGVVK